MAAGPIPWTAINEYAIRHAIDGEDFEELVEMVRKMDNAWLDHSSKSNKAASAE
jgi:hypothetical protein